MISIVASELLPQSSAPYPIDTICEGNIWPEIAMLLPGWHWWWHLELRTGFCQYIYVHINKQRIPLMLYFPVRMVKHWSSLPRTSVVSWSCSESDRTWSEQPDLSRVGQMISIATFQLQLLCDVTNMRKRGSFLHTQETQDMGCPISNHMLIMFGVFSSSQIRIQNRIKTKL